ncbi:MAG: phosphoenolpyruvate carboxykinase domain-containing protein, partial [Bacteroidales bacterium]
LPKIFFVNWFRKDEGKFLWPGYGENSRVLAYIFDRCNGEGKVKETPIGKVPAADGINIEGLDITPAQMEKALAICTDEWKAEIALIEEHYASFGQHLPEELSKELKALKKRLGLESCCCCG